MHISYFDVENYTKFCFLIFFDLEVTKSPEMNTQTVVYVEIFHPLLLISLYKHRAITVLCNLMTGL